MSEEFLKYKEGEQCVELNKRVEMLIMSASDYFVFLDEDLFVQWLTKPGFDTKKASGVLNKVSYLEAISTPHFAGIRNERGELGEFRRLLGESLARAFDGNLPSAHELLRASQALLYGRSVQRAREWYLTAAGIAACVPLVGLAVAVLARSFAKATLGEAAFEVLLSSMLGGIGALVSTLFSVRKVNLNASVGQNLHYIEGAARIVTGCVGGALMVLAIKGNLALGAINSMADNQSKLAAVFACAIAAGASERFMPNFIKKIENAAVEDSQDSS